MIDNISKLVRITEAQTQPAAQTLARAFYDYPLFVYLFPDQNERRNELPLLFESQVRYGVLHGEVYATSSNLEGVAVWLPPGFPGGFSFTPSISMGALIRNDHWGREVWRVRKRHVTISHWFLELIGILPEYQGKSYARVLLAPMLARIEGEYLPCYLDTEVEKNVAIYQHYGFKVVEETDVRGTGIHSWGMLRKQSIH
jgi:GNAT superfamily N-acetyltransferase